MIFMLDRYKSYMGLSVKHWRKFADRHGLDFRYETYQDPTLRPNYNKWLWPRFVPEDVPVFALVDSDAVPLRHCDNFLLYNKEPFNAARIGCAENHCWQINGAKKYLSVDFEWDQCINSGITVIRNTPETRDIANQIAEFNRNHPEIQVEQTYSQAYAASRGVSFGYLPGKFNFLYAPNEAYWESKELSQFCHVAHFPGLPEGVRLDKMRRMLDLWG